MRAVIFILIIAVLILIGAIASGFLNISQTRQAQVPTIGTTGNGVTAKGGQAPGFAVQTGSVSVGSKESNVKVPTLQVNRPGGANPQQPQPQPQATPQPAPAGNAQ